MIVKRTDRAEIRRTPEHCSDCKYFVPGQRVSTEPHDGSCHFSPPSNYATPRPDSEDDEIEQVEDDGDFITLRTISYVDNTYTGWPIVLASDWCGRHEARPQPRTRKSKEQS
jgi:hypothetical protein